MKASPRRIYQRLRGHGWSHAQACGILGNIRQESNFDTAALGFDGTGSYGLCQWLGGRKSALKRYAESKGMHLDDPMLQIDFLHHELLTSEARAGARLQCCKTPGGAAVSFSRNFERPHKDYAHNDARIRYAVAFAKEMGLE